MLERIFDNLSRRAAIWVKEWNKNSVERKRLTYPAIERVLRWAGEHTAGFVFSVWFAAISISVALGWVAPSCFGLALVPADWNEAELLAYFGTLWTVQATIAALVYPIVIAFVAVLLQRRATATLSLRLYALDAAVAPAGSSAIALMLWMGLQYAGMSYAPTTWLAAAMAGNSVWFVLNSLLTGWFLYRTVRFLDDEARLDVFKRFAVHIAFQREIHEHLLGLIFSNAQSEKLIPGGVYGSEEAGPQVLLYPVSHGKPCIAVDLDGERLIADVRLRLLRWAVALWLRQAKRAGGSPAIAGMRPQYPLLEIPLAPGHVVDGTVVLCRVQYGPTPGPVAAFLIRHSVVFAPPPAPNVSYSTAEILEEISVEALELAERRRFEAASEMVIGMVDLHAALIRSGAFVNDAGEQDNAALLPDPYGFGSRRAHERWLDAYRSLAEMAVRNLPLDSTLYDRHCYLAYRLINSLRAQDLDIILYSLHLSTYLTYRLGIWWSDKAEERGLVDHDALHAVVLPPPLGGTYDRALQKFIGGWEELLLAEPEEDRSSPEEAWAAHRRHARFAATQAERTVHMLLGAVLRGDRAAALWFADSFLKWWSKLEHWFEGHASDGAGNRLLTLSCIGRKWSEVRSLLDAVPEGAQELTTIAEVAATILRRYWTDLRLTLVCILIDWTPPTAPIDSFALELAIALLQGRNLKHGDRVDVDALTNPPSVLLRLIRLQLADREYEEMLDKIVSHARDLRRPGMVSGRIYDFSGPDDFESLCLAQAQVLTAITTAAIGRLPDLVAATRVWSPDLDHLKQLKRLAQSLDSSMDSEAFRGKRLITGAIRNAIGLPDNVEEAAGWVSATFKDLVSLADATHDETLEAACVSQARLDDLGKAICDYVLGAENKVFPFTLKPEIEAVLHAGEPRLLAVAGVNKAAYTDPPLDNESTSMRRVLSENVTNSIGGWLVSDYLTSKGVAPLRADSELVFFEDMAARAKAVRDQGCSPLLLLPAQRIPEWLRPWRYQMHPERLPGGVSVRPPRPDDSPSVVGYFNDIPAHRTPLGGQDCYLVATEAFIRVAYENRGGGSCVLVSHTPQENHKLRLMFEWAFAPV